MNFDKIKKKIGPKCTRSVALKIDTCEKVKTSKTPDKKLNVHVTLVPTLESARIAFLSFVIQFEEKARYS